MVLAPIVRGRKGEFKKEMDKLAQHGFTRARIDGELRQSAKTRFQLDKRRNHTIEVVIDRLLVKPGIEQRLEQSVGLAMKLAGGLVQVAVVGGEEQLYSAQAGLPGLRHQRARYWSRARFRSTAFTARARSAMGWAASTISIRRKVIADWSKPLLDGGLGPGSASQNLIQHAADRGGGLWIRSRHAV